MLLGKGIMINWADVAIENRVAYDTWHCHEHTVGRVAIPGFQRGRRYIAAQATRDFLTMYEVDDLSVLTGPDYLAKANDPSPLTRTTTPVIKNSVRGLSRVRASFGDATGGCALTLRFDPVEGRETELERYFAGQALPRIAQRADIAGAHLIVADREASMMTPVERQGRPTVIPNWIVLIEGFTLTAVNAAADAELADASLHAHGCAPVIERDTYSLQFLVPKSRTVQA
jgi:hypothetical protein